MKDYLIEVLEPTTDYELLDSGDGEKLERYGKFVLSRPDPQALWHKSLPVETWKKADAYFERREDKASWKVKGEMPKEWTIELEGLKFLIKPTSFKHTGLFPEQASNWKWIREKIKAQSAKLKTEELKPIKVLNLFAYTGGATLAALSAGAEVTHVDGSKASLEWAKKNAELSGLKDKPVRWLLDDARRFVEREIRRGSKYDAIIMDPPAFGHGAKDEVWKIEDDFMPLLDACQKILVEKPLFIILNGYSAGYSAVGYKNALKNLTEGLGGEVSCGELTITDKFGKRLPAGIFARYED
jgi:23S rRNA (cytosine1962-C5)-methyltransferase